MIGLDVEADDSWSSFLTKWERAHIRLKETLNEIISTKNKEVRYYLNIIGYSVLLESNISVMV